MNIIAIIGTAGRKEDAKKLNAEKFQQMRTTTLQLLGELDIANSIVISGGAAWADRLAVNLFVHGEIVKLRLYLPCAFDKENRKFVDDGTIDWQKNPGGTSNYYHRQFSDKIEVDTLGQIADAIDEGAELVEGGGLFDRNGRIAKSATHIIGLTFGAKEQLKNGGTADTMQTYLKQRIKMGLEDNSYHIDLNTMKVHKGAKVE